jgi:hypothetical protein
LEDYLDKLKAKGAIWRRQIDLDLARTLILGASTPLSDLQSLANTQVKGNPYASFDSTHKDNFIPQNFADYTAEKTESPNRWPSTWCFDSCPVDRVFAASCWRGLGARAAVRGRSI